MIVFLVLAALSGLAAAAGVAQRQVRMGRRASPVSFGSLRPLAEKWAAARGLPVSWVLATILVENPRLDTNALTVTPKERSYGLMQINWLAHSKSLLGRGITEEQLYDPDTNVMIGSEILSNAYAKAKAAAPAVPVADATRMVYTGRSPHADPNETKTANSLARWHAALARVGASGQLVA